MRGTVFEQLADSAWKTDVAGKRDVWKLRIQHVQTYHQAHENLEAGMWKLSIWQRKPGSRHVKT